MKKGDSYIYYGTFSEGRFSESVFRFTKLVQCDPKKRKGKGKAKKKWEGRGKRVQRSENRNQVFGDIVHKKNINVKRIYKAILL